MTVNIKEPVAGTKTGNPTFAAVLRDLMLEKRVSASDLARKVWGTTEDYRGYKVAKNRDRIGHYLSGKSYPEKENLIKIAKALGVSVDKLQAVQPPPVVREARTPKDIELNVLTSGQDQGLSSLSVNKVILTLKTSMEIMELIAKDPVHAKRVKSAVKA